MKLTLKLFLILSAVLASANAPRVTVESGELEGLEEEGVHAYKGIPYAAPPVGELRWRAPQPPVKWAGVRSARDYGNDAPQKRAGAKHQDEDCLFLNVWSPADAARRPYPVMVWIHGGAMVTGSGRCGGGTFARHGVVLVSLNYRLGRFGAFAHPALMAESPAGEPPGNFWLLDQIAALEWVQRNIAGFGGDPQRVTVFGVSSGGTAVNMLMISPRAKGLFHRAIAQSGIGGFGPFRRLAEKQGNRESQAALGERFAAKMSVDESGDVPAALRALPWEKVADLGDGESGVEPVVDGVTIPDDPQRVFATGRQHRVPFIAGANSFEGNLSLIFPWGDGEPKPKIMDNIARLAPLYGKAPGDKSLMLDLYGDLFFRVSARSLVGQMQRVGTPAWFYHFDYVRKSARKNSPGAGHGAEVPYVFGEVPFFPAAEDKAVARTMHGHWIQFAKTGNPNGAGLPDWPAFTTAAPAAMVYSAGGVRAVPDLDKAKFALLTELLTQVWPMPGATTPPAAPQKPGAPAAPAAKPETKPAPEGVSEHKLNIDGVERMFLLHKGKTPAKPLPLVVVLHGGGGSAKILPATYGFKPLVEAGECLAIYPDAIKGAWMPDDVAFLDAAIEQVFASEPVDRTRLFVTGASRGGLMTLVMAAKSKHTIRAAGTVIASHMQGLADEFPLTRPVDFAMIAGTEDPLMPYAGGRGAMKKPKPAGDPKLRILPVEDTIALLLKANSITGDPQLSTLGDADRSDGCTNEVRDWKNPANGRRVRLVKVIGGGHVVPGGAQYLPKDIIGPACRDFEHARVMWEFFKSSAPSSR